MENPTVIKLEKDESSLKEEVEKSDVLSQTCDSYVKIEQEVVATVQEQDLLSGVEKKIVNDHSQSEAIEKEDVALENEDNVNDPNDPFAYLQRPEFSSENFKVEIMNLPKYYGAGQLKKFMTKQQINVHKLKLMGNYVFATFRNEEDRQKGMDKLKGCSFKGKILDVKLAKPMQDPLIRKRKAQADPEGEKKPRIEEPIEIQITRKSSPYAGKPYNQQVELKKKDMVKVLTTLTKEIKKANYPIKPYIRSQMEANEGLICPLVDIIPSPVLEKYRNKCDFTIGMNPETDNLTVGFRVSTYKEGSIAVAPIAHLAFIPDAMKSTVQLFEAHFRASDRKPFNPEDHSGFWRQLLVRTNLTGEVLAIVMVHPQDLTQEEMDQVRTGLRAVVEGTHVTSLHFQAFGKKMSNEEPSIEHLAGSTHLLEKLCGIEFSISPLAFFQINTLAAEVLYNKIGEMAEVDENTNILDVCCGTGSIGLSLAKKCRKVYGVELIPSAVEDAKQNAKKNDIGNCVFVAGKAEDELAPLIKQIESETGEETNNKTVAIVDPPRAGLQRRSCQLLRSMENIQRLIYVSCNAEAAMKSFVDLCRAESNCYKGIPFVPVKALAVDLFPDTPHCELILVLERYRVKK